ncbi:MAG: glycosyltransferase family 1 protein [Synechococcales cyanobacterium RM1_1_8]|nr:glycosyltransferase family 1 protein [Synechococcales cyanobacterium RM1_1_8]
MALYLLSSRHLEAFPQMTIVYDLENIMVETCGAQLLMPKPRGIKCWDLRRRSHLSKFAGRIARKTIGEYHPIQLDQSLEQTTHQPEKKEPRVLMIMALNGNGLELLSALPRWRQDFDLVVAYVIDCWMLETLPAATQQLDHLFIPYPALKSQVQACCKPTVSVLPLGFDVLNHGRGVGLRSIDVMSYGRTPALYHRQLMELAAGSPRELSYYRQILEAGEILPTQQYGLFRHDYQHRLQLNQMLRHSKIVLAFENLYTTRLSQQPGSHITQRLQDSIVTTRWFEGTACGCVLVGKRPQSSVMHDYLGWPDSSLELPDDAVEGVAFLRKILGQPKRLQTISQRNYSQSLRFNDWRLRLRSLFEQISLPVPPGLKISLEQLEHCYQQQERIFASDPAIEAQASLG